MDLLASFYPALPDRKPLYAFYTPACFLLSIFPFLIENKRLTSSLTFPLMMYLCFTWPFFTTNDPSTDYYNNSHFIAVPLWYLDFVLSTPRDGDDAPAFIGQQTMVKNGAGTNHPPAKHWKDLTTFFQRAKWAFRLMLPAQRGIGWNWQVKGVPADPDVALPRWTYVGRKALWALLYYLQSVMALACLGIGLAMREHLEPEQKARKLIAGAVVGWAGAVWVWDRLCCAYNLAAALAVAVGLSETWEWPPLMGRLEDAWSVRQMWSSTYHQNCRRLLSQPSIRIVRFLGLTKGSLSSSYTQLFTSFGISCLFHQAQMFNVTRKDMGELVFFMSQPLAIGAEDLVQWLWRRSAMSSKDGHLEKAVGYLWVFAWFSFSLQMYITGLVEAQVMKDWVFGYQPLDVGAEIGRRVLIWLM